MTNVALSDIHPLLFDRLSLFVQANGVANKKDISNILSGIDIVELIHIFRNEIIDQLKVTKVTFETGIEALAGGPRKYQKDKGFHKFWDDVQIYVTEAIEQCFLRQITLSSTTKIVPHLMAKRFCAVVVAPTINHFRKIHPENVLVGAIPFFKWMEEVACSVEPNFHETDILVARKRLYKLSKEDTTPPLQKRLETIKTVVEKMCE